MAEQNFPVEGPVTVHILEVRGDLEVVGWAEGRVSVVADEDEMPDAAWREGALTLRGRKATYSASALNAISVNQIS